MKKINYQRILKRIEILKVPKNNTSPIIIVAEKLGDGNYQVKKTFDNYQTKDILIKNEEKLKELVGKIDQEKCSIIIDDIVTCVSKPLINKVILNCTSEELYKVINAKEGEDQVIGQILKRNLQEIVNLKGNVL